MFREVLPFDILGGFTLWLMTTASLVGVILGIALLVSLVLHGGAFLGNFSRGTREVLVDLVDVSPRRIGAIMQVTIKESVRRKALLVFVVFVIVFMFANWFLGGDDELSSAKPYISTVLMALNWMIIPVALLLSCWGLPADIKDRSLHTVVTKPVRRSEVLLGRMLGYCAVSLVMLAAMGAVGYVWIIRSVPELARDQLIGRVPQYGTLKYLGDDGVVGIGKNVGDMWEYRSFVSGGTKSCGVYTFEKIDTEAIRAAGVMRLEYKWEAFRTYKGDIETPVRFRIYLINPDTELTVRISTRDFEIQEFAVGSEDTVIDIPIAGISPRPGADGEFYVTAAGADLASVGGQFDPQHLNLVDDLIADGKLIVRAYCVDNMQHIGMARHDLFIRLPDRPFMVSYAKSVLNTALMVILIVVLGTTASCFLKGPVATILTFGLIILGQGLREMMDDLLKQFYDKESPGILGGGPLESAYRLLHQMNQQSELPENLGTQFIENADQGIMHTVGLTRNFFPNFNHFDTREFLANGFDIPFDASVLAALAVTASFVLPCYVIGYLSLRFRELEVK